MESLSKKYMNLYSPKEGYVFVVTYGRSGSTLTQHLLNTIPGYCIRGENGNILYFFSRALHFVMSDEMYVWRRGDKDLLPERAKEYLKNIYGKPYDPWYGAELVDVDSFARSLFDVFVSEILHIDSNVRVAGFKEVRYLNDPSFFNMYMQIIEDFFPNVRFIFQTRHYKDVAASSWWRNMKVEEVKKIVESMDTLFLSYMAGKSNCHLIQYEDYLKDGLGVAKRLMDFLGELYDEAKVNKVLNSVLRH